MGSDFFTPDGTHHFEVDNDGMALTGPEVSRAVCEDLQVLTQKVQEMLDNHPDMQKQYAYPRVRWIVRVEITPFYTDEEPVHIEACGGVADTTGTKQAEEIKMEAVQDVLIDPDTRRPEKKRATKKHEESSQQPVHEFNPMVRRKK